MKNLDRRIGNLEASLRRQSARSIKELSDAELEEMIGIRNPTNEQLDELIRQAAQKKEVADNGAPWPTKRG